LQTNNSRAEYSNSKTAVLLINLGTPDAPETTEVRAYLRKLLSSERVLDINPLVRWLLLNLFILPFRPRESAKAYRKIWLPEGSPLLVYSQKLKNALIEPFAEENIHVELAMQCGEPSLKKSLARLREQGNSRIIVLPLYPQYASSTYGGALEDLYKELLHDWNMPDLQIIPPFFSDSRFIEAWAKVGLPFLENKPDHVLFSFHGLPLRHIKKSDPSGNWCRNDNECCLELADQNRYCYSAHCHQTSKLLADRLNLEAEKWSVSFQSRFGREEWIKPYTEQHLKKLAESGVKRVVVFCPSFVADSLETLEEIGIRAAEHFRECGGEELELVPSLNNHPEWIKALTSIIRQQLSY
jgi:ferrochelatase